MKVDVEAVETELARLQRELTNSEVRTSLFNLVVMSPDAERAMVDAALTYMLGKRAARVIHIVNKPEAESDLEVSARCFVDREHKGVCFEEIIITNGADGAGGAPGSWIPLLVRDIPSYVLWLDTLTDKQELFSHAQAQADKVIVDSDHCVELGDDPDNVLRALAENAVDESVPTADFSWKRLRPHRRLAAAAFDGEEHVSWLAEVARVDVCGLRPVAARLYGLWLAERLGWTPVAGSRGGGAPEDAAEREHTDGSIDAIDRYRDPRGREVDVARGAHGADDEVTVTVTLTDGRTLTITAAANGCADVELPDGSEEPVVSIPSNGEILLEEVDAVYADDLYRSALELVR